MDLLRQPTIVFCLLALLGAAIATSLAGPQPNLPEVSGESLEEARVRALLEGEVRGIGRRAPGGWSLDVELAQVDRVRLDDGLRARLFVPNELSSWAVLEGRAHRADRPPALAGDRFEVFGRIEAYEPQLFADRRGAREAMAARGVDARATALEPLAIVGRDDALFGRLGADWLIRRLALTRAGFERRLLEADALTDQQAALAVALTTANRSFMEPATAAPFRQTGTAHLLAISGLHLGVLAALVWWLCGLGADRFPALLRRFGRRRVCGAAVIAALGCYVLAIGAPVSAVRALVAIGFGVVALLLMRPMCPFHALAAAAIALVGWQPAVVWELGFQLSFAATLGILLFLRFRPAALAPPPVANERANEWANKEADSAAEAKRRRRLRSLGLFVGVSTSATVSTWPVACAHFGEVALAGVWVNLIVTPLVSALLFPVLVAGVLVAHFVEPAGFFLIGASTEAMLGVGGLLEHVAALPGAQWVTGTTPWWATLALAAGALALVTSRWRRARLYLGAALLAIGLSPGFFDLPHERDGELHVHFIPVGQGDATFVGFPDGTTMLVDGGGRRLGRDPGRFVVVPYLRRLGVARLDWVVLTHADTDHLGGLFAVVEQMRPRHVVFDALERDEGLEVFRRRAAEVGARLHPVERRLEHSFGGVAVDVVRPQIGAGAQNDASLVTRLVFGPAAVLLPGDVERAAEQWLVDHEPFGAAGIGATVLKAPHHGSKTSSTAAFLEAVDPQVAVISAGRFSRFGHPHAQVLARYRRRGVAVFQTALDGLVRVEIGAAGQVEVRRVEAGRREAGR